MVDGKPCLSVPDHGGFALVGDADCADIAGLEPGFGQRLACRGQLRAPDLNRVMLDPARLGVDLRQLLLRQRDDVASRIEHDAAGTGGALVEGEQVGHGRVGAA